jgi:RIO-like serine/threonine protein kinase
MFESIKLSELDRTNCGILRKATSTRPYVWQIEENQVRAVVKDFSRNGFFYRNIVGRFLVWRESKAYKRLEEVKNIPTLYRTIGGIALVLEAIDGKDMGNRAAKNMEFSENFFHEIREIVKEAHRHGVVHCDLKAAPNTLVDNEGHPHIIDWAACMCYEEFRIFPLNLIYKRFIKDDLLSILKLQLKRAPGTVSQEDADMLHTRSRTERIIRAIRNTLRVFLQRIA